MLQHYSDGGFRVYFHNMHDHDLRRVVRTLDFAGWYGHSGRFDHRFIEFIKKHSVSLPLSIGPWFSVGLIASDYDAPPLSLLIEGAGQPGPSPKVALMLV